MTSDEFLNLLQANSAGQPFDVRLSADEVLRLVERRFGGEMSGLIEDLSLALTTGEVVVGGRVGFLGMLLQVQLVGRPALENGQVQIEVRELTVNGMAAPAILRNQLDLAMAGRLEPDQLGMELDLLEIETGVIHLCGRTVSRREDNR
jgi:hypothetical protein